MTQIVLGKIGTPDGPSSARLDLGRLIESRLLLQANSGAGKSWALRRLLEQSHGHVQHLVLDIEGEFHTLREKFDYVLAARAGGDTLADTRTAPLLARRLLELGVSAILDLYELKAHERIRFVRLFLEALLEAPRSLWHPVLVVVDEAHHFCPQKGDAESAAAVIDLMTRGRKRGFCGVLATQRLSKLHKDAAAEANVKLIGRASLDVDIDRAAEELGLKAKDDRLRIRSLPTGTFFAFGPGLSDQVVEVLIGDVQTTHPRPGQRAAPVPPAREKVKKALAQLADLPKEAEAEARSAAELRLEVATLKRQLTSAAKAAPPAPAATVVEKPVLKDAQVKRLEALAVRMIAEAERHGRAMAMFWDNQNEGWAAMLGALRAVAAPPTKPASPRPTLVPPPAVRPPAAAARPVNGVARPSGGLQRMLIALAQRPQGLTRQQLGLRAQLSSRSGTFDTYLGRGRSYGWIVNEGDLLQITDVGMQDLGTGWQPLPTGAALLEYWKRELGGGASRMLAALAEAYPGSLTRDELGERAAISSRSGTFDTYLGKMRGLELIHGRGDLRAAEELFAE